MSPEITTEKRGAALIITFSRPDYGNAFNYDMAERLASILKPLTTHLALEHTHWGASTRTFDFKEAVRAYFAKRPAKYTGA